MKFDEIIDGLIQAGADAAFEKTYDRFGYDLHEHKEFAESPIELIMLAALMAEGERRDTYASLVSPKMPANLRERVLFRDQGSPGFCSVAIQFPIGDYRVDFCLCFYHDVKIVVECDGHDFHERTQEQALRDRSRDRAIQALGYQVFRFTGREIWRDALRCAGEVFAAADRESGRRVGRDTSA